MSPFERFADSLFCSAIDAGGGGPDDQPGVDDGAGDGGGLRGVVAALVEAAEGHGGELAAVAFAALGDQPAEPCRRMTAGVDRLATALAGR